MFSEHLVPPRGVEPWLELLMQITGCTLNVQPANLHKNFFRRKARQGIFPAPFDFTHSSRNIKLLLVILREEPEISKEARSGQHQPTKFNDFLG